MTKEQFLSEWGFRVDGEFSKDLDAVIATEIAKAKVQPQPSDKVQISKHTLVEVNRAFRALKQDRNSYIHKVFSDDGVFDAMEEIRKMFDNYFVEQPQEAKPALNPIVEAYHNYKPIRYIDWDTSVWIKKHCDGYSIDERGEVYKNDSIQFNFDESPQHWELYTEPAEQSSSQAKLDNSFDRERFEAMFSSMVAREPHWTYKDCMIETEKLLKQLDAYYASKEGGNNE